MNKFKRKPVPFSSVALGRRMAADAQRERVKAAKRKPITFWATLLPDDVPEVTQGGYEVLSKYFGATLPEPTTVDNGDGTYTRTYSFSSVD